jgi:chaperone required for assembly of F1-ATPase
MKRFWTAAVAVEGDNGFTVALDGRGVKTPARRELAVPTKALAAALAGEWQAVGESIDPRAMPLTGLANAAIDRVAEDPDRFARDLGSYAENDLLCYRAEGPSPLVERQAAAWDPLLAWARRRFDVDFVTVTGIMHRPQPEKTVAKLRHAVASLDPFRLAGLSPMVTIGGSLVAAVAVLEKAVAPKAVWEQLTVDERWQADQWGADAEATAALANRRRDFLAAARFLELLDA